MNIDAILARISQNLDKALITISRSSSGDSLHIICDGLDVKTFEYGKHICINGDNFECANPYYTLIGIVKRSV